MFCSANLYLRQTAPTCQIASWSLNLAVERAMVHTRVCKEGYKPEFFADTETAQFPPWPMNEHLAFGYDLIPTLVHSLEVTRRTKPCLQMLRSLERVLSDPENCMKALERNVLKALTTLIIKGRSEVKLWALACLRVIAGNPYGKTSIASQRVIMRQICGNLNSPEPQICEMVYTILFRLSENWFGMDTYKDFMNYLLVPTLQKYSCIELVMKTIFTEVEQINLNQKRIACLLNTLVNLIDYKDGVQKAIRYDLFDLTWLLTCGFVEVEHAMLRVLVHVAADEFGRLGIRYKLVGKQLLETFYDSISEGTDSTPLATVLMLATLPNMERDDYQKMNAIDVVMKILQEPNLSDPTKLVLLRLLTNLVELPEGRKVMRNHLQTLISNQICDNYVREATALLIKKTLSAK